MDFNKKFNDEGTKPPFTYKRNPLIKHAFQIFMYKEDKEDYEPIGEYTLLDMSEDLELTEKTVMNLISSLNGRKDRMIDLKNLTSERLLFNIVNNENTEESDHITIMLRSHDGMGVSKENAVLKIEKGVFQDETHNQ